MATPAAVPPRPYLAAPERRAQLLDAAGRLVRRGGWSALSMQGLAAAAGVSRQLVYEHFKTVDELILATLEHLFERAYTATRAIVDAGGPVADTIRASLTLCLDLPPEERRAVRTLAAEPEPGRPALTRARRRLRSRIAGIWAPYCRLQTGVGEAEATALGWMLTTAAWGLADAIADGTVGRREGVELFVRFVESTFAAWRAPRPRGERRR